MMRGKIVGFVAGVMLAVSVGVWAQTSGIPARLRVQKVTVAGTENEKVTLRGNATGVGNIAYLRIRDSSGTAIAQIGDTAGGNADLYVTNEAGGDIRLNTVAGNGVRINGSRVPRMAFGTYICSIASTCTAEYEIQGVTSATWDSTGAYTLDLTAAGFTSPPTCLASLSSSTGITTIARATATSPTSAQVRSFNLQGNLQNSGFSVLCLGY